VKNWATREKLGHNISMVWLKNSSENFKFLEVIFTKIEREF
jgi:hypothetical protein